MVPRLYIARDENYHLHFTVIIVFKYDIQNGGAIFFFDNTNGRADKAKIINTAHLRSCKTQLRWVCTVLFFALFEGAEKEILADMTRPTTLLWAGAADCGENVTAITRGV